MNGSLGNFNVCGLTRVLVAAMLVAMSVSTITGSDAAGWVAAGITVAIVLIARKVRGIEPTCAVDFGASTPASTTTAPVIETEPAAAPASEDAPAPTR